ncbi:hypothetical protein AMJ80_01920 [bacterium SM23_31]|nr:MAG: hypothetical protein AMJ80_01920 [bacterium SM23_31]
MTMKDKIPALYDETTGKTERTATAVLMHWMREIIEENQLDIGLPDVETIGKDRKMPDIVIYESLRSVNILCLLEAKRPFFDVYNAELKEEARAKASKRKVKYFGLINFKKLILYDTEKVNACMPEEEQKIHEFKLSEIESLDFIEQSRFKEPIKENLYDFLKILYELHTGKKDIPKLPLDEFWINFLNQKINILSYYYIDIIEDKCHKDVEFRKQLQKWFVTQGWSFSWKNTDYERAARQTAYFLVNKIIFYSALYAKYPGDFDPLTIPEEFTKGSIIHALLQGFFNLVLKKDYETIYTTDFIDVLAFPESREVMEEIKSLVKALKRYDFSDIGFEVIGRIFERLIPPSERHKLGQYFTNPDIVDIILSFCIKHENDRVLDPSCGAGTFLVRAYQYKKMKNRLLSHEEILETLWGNDIAKFPAHLATINLAIKDLAVEKNYPNILEEDFFGIPAGKEGFDPEQWRKKRANTLSIPEREVIYPRWFDAVVGNPPYTRQEEMGEISPKNAEYKKQTIQRSLYCNDEKIADINKRAGIHAYFFVHGTKLLNDGGYFGFIVSNSWLDVDYGKGLQEFFLNNYKIVAIIESKVERWFIDADINTCIVILQKCKNAAERNDNLVRFVYLKKRLSDIIPAPSELPGEQIERKNKIEDIINTILAHNSFYESETFRIYPKSQKELWDEGYDTEKEKYTGAKWGKYVRAPKIFFTTLEKGKDKLVPLKEIADVRRGFTTGANEFFYLTEEKIKKKRIEKEFWMHKDKKGNWESNKVIVSPKEGKYVVIYPENLKKIVLFIDKENKQLKGKRILEYIKQGEANKFHKRPTCKSRKKWYYLELRQPWPILYPMIHYDRQTVILNKFGVQVDHNLFEIKTKRKRDIIPLICFLLSSLSMLIKEFSGRVSLGEGALKTEGIDIERLPVPKEFAKEARGLIRKLTRKFSNVTINSIFEDLQVKNPEEVTLDKVKPDRRELDKIIMGDILGFTDEEQLEVYRAVVDLVKSRIEKAKSLGKNKKTADGIDTEKFKNTIVTSIDEEPHK